MENVAVVTTMNLFGFEQTGQNMINTFLQFWPSHYHLHLFCEDFEINLDKEAETRISCYNLHEAIPELQKFKTRNIEYGKKLEKEYDYRLDALKFSNKVFCQCFGSKNFNTRYMLWLDADVRTFREIPFDFIPRLLTDNYFIAYLGRKLFHSETGFVAYDLYHNSAQEFFDIFEDTYKSDEIFNFNEWHDSFVFDTLKNALAVKNNFSTKDLNYFLHSSPFVNSIPGLFMDHMKGPGRKEAGASHSKEFIVPKFEIPLHKNISTEIGSHVEKTKPKYILDFGGDFDWCSVITLQHVINQEKKVKYGIVAEDLIDRKIPNNKISEKDKEAGSRLLILMLRLYPEIGKLKISETFTKNNPKAPKLVLLRNGCSRQDFENYIGQKNRNDCYFLPIEI